MTNSIDTDPRPRFARALAVATEVVAGVRPDQLGDPTPCAGMTVRELMAHMVGVLDRVTAIGAGRNPMEVMTDGLEIPDEDFAARWRDAVHAVEDAWRDDSSLDHPIWLPWQEGRSAEVLDGSYLSELLVHTWDLATATGQQPDWPDDAAGVALEKFSVILPANRGERFAAVREAMQVEFDDPFGPVVEVPSTATPIQRLAAWSGRRVTV